MWWYNLGIHAYGGIVKSLARFKPKARLWTDGRRGIFERLRSAIPEGAKVVWVHSASLGEFEQGRPLIEAIRREQPGYKILLTFFSPSGYEIRKDYKEADYVFYLPADTPRNARRFLDIVKPEIAIFIKYEFWLNYLTELRHRKVRTFIVSAIFRRNSIFFRPYGGTFRRALKGYEHIFVQDEASKELLSGIGVGNVTVAGDTRFDRVAEIARGAKELPLIEKFTAGRQVFIGGSTWEPDENIIVGLANENPDLKFIVAPHEMEIARITALMEKTKGGAVSYSEYAKTGDGTSRQMLVIDIIGILSSVYRYGNCAFIGGGFGAGIHNTLEAVTFGLPVAFGPNYHKFREARELIAEGVACPVADAGEAAVWLKGLRSDPVKYGQLREAAAEYIRSHEGATGIVMEGIFGSEVA